MRDFMKQFIGKKCMIELSNSNEAKEYELIEVKEDAVIVKEARGRENKKIKKAINIKYIISVCEYIDKDKKRQSISRYI